MEKNFTQWNEEKTKTDKDTRRVFFHEREIWWCKIGLNVGFEQDGRGRSFARPILVFKKFNNEVFWAVPLSTKIKKGKFYFSVKLDDDIERVAILSQLRLIDAKRLYQKVGIIKEVDFDKIKLSIIKLCQ